MSVSTTVWQQCLNILSQEYTSTECSIWFSPLQAETKENTLYLLAPNRFVVEHLKKYHSRIQELVIQISADAIHNGSHSR